MATLTIEMDRGRGWEIRSEGTADVSAEQVRISLAAYAIQYPHRAWLDGEIIATADPEHGKARQ